MANYYGQISGGIRGRQADMMALERERMRMQEERAAKEQAAQLAQTRQNILKQYFAPAQDELQAMGGNSLQTMMDKIDQGQMPQGDIQTQVVQREARFDPRGAMGALFGAGDIEGARAVSQFAQGQRSDQFGTSGDLIEMPDGSLVRRQYSSSGDFRDIPIGGKLATPLTSYQQAELSVKEREQKRREEEAAREADIERQRLEDERRRRREESGFRREELDIKRTEAQTKASSPNTSEGERQAAGFFGRMNQSSGVINNLEAQGSGLPTVATTVTGAVLGDFAQRKAMTPEQQKYKNAADAWIRAKLRKESGAVIGEEESKAEYRTYFPVPGDTPDVIRQKSLLRREAEEEMRISAGRALQAGEKKTEQSAMPKMPPAAQHKGRIVRDTASGVRYQSDGSKWVRVK